MSDNSAVRCASCAALDVFPSRPRSALENGVITFLPLAYRRCHTCMHRRLGIDLSLASIGGSVLRLAAVAAVVIVLYYFLTA